MAGEFSYALRVGGGDNYHGQNTFLNHIEYSRSHRKANTEINGGGVFLDAKIGWLGQLPRTVIHF